MKKSTLVLSFLLGAGSMSVMAEGYQVNLLSAKQAGMGHTGVAMKLGAESMHFNPAGMAFMESTADFSVGISGVISEAKWKHEGQHAKTDNDVSTPIYAYAGFKVYDNLAIGFSFTTPYGNGLRWNHDWVGATLVQEINLKAFSFQPTISWRPLDNLSIGAGLMMAFGNFDLSRALLPAGSLPAPFNDVVPVSAYLSGESVLKLGVNVGALWDINDQLSIGASFRSRMNMHVKEGNARLDYASETIKTLISSMVPPLDKGTFSAELPLPSNVTVGASYKPIDKLLLALDLQLVQWGAYDELVVQFSQEVLDGYSIQATKNYKNTICARLGAQYGLTERFDVRAGIYFDQSPVRKNYYNPETPGMNKIGTSVGFSFCPFDGFSIDFSALYIAGLSRDGSYTYKNTVGQDKEFKGHYTSNAFCPSLGLSYKF